MLETDELSILPWSAADDLRVDDGPEIVAARRILDARTGKCLGFAAAQRKRWWSGTTLRVHETEDASLLFSLYRPWGILRSWQVYDAEERLIGTFNGNYLFDGMGYLLACLHEDEAGAGTFVTRPGVELGSCSSRADGTWSLAFS